MYEVKGSPFQENNVKRIKLVCAMILLLCMGGCYSTRSGLPTHIRTVEVPVFGNNTQEIGLEGILTRYIIQEINLTPGLSVVSENGDATLSGRIGNVVSRINLRDRDDRPASASITVYASYDFYDNKEGRRIRRRNNMSSAGASGTAGRYDIDRGEKQDTARESAVHELARVIVRDAVSQW